MTEAQIVGRWGWNAAAVQALNPGLRRWRTDNALVAYGIGRTRPGGPRVWLAAGEPVGDPARLGAIADGFTEAARDSGASAAWFGASDRFRREWSGTSLAIGAQPVWRPADWPGILARKASLRAQIHRARNKGVTVTEHESSRATSLEPVRQAWLARRGLPPLQFLVETEVLSSPGPRRFLVAWQEEEIVGYLVLAPIPARRGVFVEWILQSPAAPNGTAALLLNAAFLASTEADLLTLGMAPLSTHAPLSDPAPPRHVRALLAWMRAHARRFYNFEGLERFKAKFEPHAWEPLYLLTPQRSVGFGLLHAVADVFAGARTPTRLMSRALATAAREEIRSLAR
ncbi:MAG: DUF2156 domain-containing protein [Bacteroidota bacterium]